MWRCLCLGQQGVKENANLLSLCLCLSVCVQGGSELWTLSAHLFWGCFTLQGVMVVTESWVCVPFQGILCDLSKAMHLNKDIGNALFSLMPVSWGCFGWFWMPVWNLNTLFYPDSCFWKHQKQIFLCLGNYSVRSWMLVKGLGITARDPISLFPYTLGPVHLELASHKYSVSSCSLLNLEKNSISKQPLLSEQLNPSQHSPP